MPELQHVSVSIHCEGRQLQEFAVEADGTVIGCWIPSEAGKNFEIQYQFLPQSSIKDSYKKIEFALDGRHKEYKLSSPNSVTHRLIGLRVGPEARRPFQFSTLKLTENEEVGPYGDSSVDEIGSISVRIFLTKPWTYQNEYKRRYDTVPIKRRYDAVPDKPLEIHEKSKKAGAHCVSFGSIQTASKQTSTTVPVVYLDSKPALTFNFQYRSADMLQAMGIMPTLPSVNDASEPLRKKRKVEEDSSASSNKSNAGIKPEQSDVVSQLQLEMESMRKQMKTLKRELMIAKQGKLSNTPGAKREKSEDIIDLT